MITRETKERIDVIMNKMEKNYEAPAIYEEVIDERDIVTTSIDNDVDIGDIIF